MQPEGKPATDDVCTTAHGGTTDSGSDKSAQSDDSPSPLSQTAPIAEVSLKDRLRKRPEAQGSSSFSTNAEDEDTNTEHEADEDDDEDENDNEDDGRGNKGTEDRTPSKPHAVGDKRGRGRP